MPNHTRRDHTVNPAVPIAVRPYSPSDGRPALLKFAAPLLPSISLMHALARLVIAQDEADRRTVEYLRDELAREYQWVCRPPALPPEWRRP